jgi:hypothetical protein
MLGRDIETGLSWDDLALPHVLDESTRWACWLLEPSSRDAETEETPLTQENNEGEVYALPVVSQQTKDNSSSRYHQPTKKKVQNDSNCGEWARRANEPNKREKLESDQKNELVSVHALCTCYVIGTSVVLEC